MTKKRVLDSWKRPIEIEVTKNLSERYPEQLKLQLNHTTPATPKEFEEWQEKELDWWAEKQLPIVTLMAFVQLFMFGSMLMIFYLINLGVK